ncbi:MAG: magnesium transporter CorA [Pirellulaceae bacterium]|nr:MAG: magnesium transporter CorA [Pirellulaceae bacterium]
MSDEVHGFLERLELHPLAIETCLEAAPVTRLVAYGNSLVVPFPVYPAWPPEDRTYLIFICLPGILVTLHREPIPVLTHIIDQYADGMRFHQLRTSALLYQIVDHMIDEDIEFTRRVRCELDDLDDLFDEDDDAAISRAVPLKRQLSRLGATFEDQLYCVEALQTIESAAFRVDGLRDYFRDAITHLEHAVRSIRRQQHHLNAIQQGHHLKLQDKTNDQLRVLTIISTVFMPLTLIAGIYGMNFRYMPELEYRYGYFITLAAMVALALVMLGGFFRAGWFR